MAAQFALKETPQLPKEESKRFVLEITSVKLTPERKEVLETYARIAKEAYKKPVK